MKIPNSMITTAFEIAGYQVTENIGMVKGISVRSIGWIGGVVGSWQSLRKGNVSKFTQLCEEARNEALCLLLDEAEKMGANAIIGLRYDTNELANIAEVFVYGTAVVMQKSN